MRPQLPLPAALGAARLAGALSRAAGRGGGTTLPGRELVSGLPASSLLVACADDPIAADLSETTPGGALRYGVDDPSVGLPAMQHAADSRWCVRCGAPYGYATVYFGHLGDYRCPRCGH